ncbi:hypothetical protein TRAPUB_2560 [Trametes pubescens]|uniref:Tf2-1-like SH3-like domain-containing protein n=1 Tax=Trametes pubescens TaxID=154538 RepID=A0A1M2VG48_TRAPU|nr:hypothetical protein TRAPUB_2560 [Trametes pubescens]
MAHDAILQSRVAMVHHANKLRADEPNPYKAGDLVYLSTRNLTLPKNWARKLAPKYIGPYRVLKANPEVSSYTLELPSELVKRRVHPTFHAALLRPHHENDDSLFPGREAKKFYDFGIPDEQEWLMDEIAGHRWTTKSIEFLVHWSTGEHTWEPLAHCDELQALDEYLALMGAVVVDPVNDPPHHAALVPHDRDRGVRGAVVGAGKSQNGSAARAKSRRGPWELGEVRSTPPAECELCRERRPPRWHSSLFPPRPNGSSHPTARFSLASIHPLTSMSNRPEARSPVGDGSPVHSKRGRMDIDNSNAYGEPEGGGNSGGGHFGGYQQQSFPPGPSQFNSGPSNYGGPSNFGPPNYGPNYGYGSGPPPPNYPPPCGGDSSGWERAADAYRELADARQKHAELTAELGDAHVKETDLRNRLRERDRTIDAAETKLKALRAERDKLAKENAALRDEIEAKTVTRRGPGYGSGPPQGGPRFVPQVHDSGWQGVTRGRGRNDTNPAPQVGPAFNASPTAGQGQVVAPVAVATVVPAAPAPPVVVPPTRAPRATNAPTPAPMANPAVAAPAASPPVVPTIPVTPAVARPPLYAPKMGITEYEIAHMTDAERENYSIAQRKGQVDVSLEASGQPLSAWYRCWTSPMSMAEAYDGMDHDDEDDDDTPGVDMVLPDPIGYFAKHLTQAAHIKEVNRAARARGSEVPEPLLSTVNPDFGVWSGTTIETVVQAHNLRWWAVVEWDEEAIRFYKFVGAMYNIKGHVRPEGIRYLMSVQNADSNRRKEHASVHSPRPPYAPRDHLGRYPDAAATIDVVWRFFRCASVNVWPKGMRLASGDAPQGDGFGIPLQADCRAAFLLWHLLPLRSKKNPHQVHDERIRVLAVELFSIPEWYNKIVAVGEFITEPQAMPIRYPYSSDDTTHVLIAAWFCAHGVGLAADVVASLRRWAIITRNKSLGRPVDDHSPWPSPPVSLNAVTTPADYGLIVKYDALAWGALLLETHESNHGNFDELDDGDDL